MRRAVTTGFMLAALAALAACTLPQPRDESLPPPPSMVELDNTATGAKVRVAKGGEVKVLLDSTPSSGFQWQGPPSVAPTLSPIQPRAHQTKSAGGGILGATGNDIFRYRADQPGKVTLTFDYRRVWEMIPPAKTVKYEITVE